MKNNNVSKGKIGEELAVRYLTERGLKILATNWRYSRYGELDIIAEDKDTLAFIEVKTRTSVAFGHPMEAINYNKINQIKTLASIYLNENPNLRYKNYRFDAVSVILKKEPEIEYYKNVYIF